MGVSIASSDLVLTAAAGQWAADKESVEDFKKTFEVWTIKCGFIADMGGTEMNPAEFVPFRVTANRSTTLSPRAIYLTHFQSKSHHACSFPSC